MTFGEQNSLPQSLRLLDQAFDAGINFFDSAEMYGVPHASSQTHSEFSAFFWLFMFIFYPVKYRYPVPQRAETQGKSEEYFGQWVRKRKISRDRVVIATKNNFDKDCSDLVLKFIAAVVWTYDEEVMRQVAGPSGQMSWIRDGPKCLDAKNITEAVDGRLVPYVMDFVSSVAPEMSPDCINSTYAYSLSYLEIVIYLTNIIFCITENNGVSACVCVWGFCIPLCSNIFMSGFHSLKRLQMDHIDLYQIHWPDRSRHFKVLHSCVSSYVPMFGETEYDPVRQFSSVPIEEQLDALGRAVDAGKIRYIGLSNETPYGVMKFLHFAENNVRYPKIISVQNSYSLLCRTFDSGMAECCHHESPLAMGILSGKYFASDGAPSDARLNLFKGRYSEGESRYSLARNTLKLATMEYLGIAEKYGLHPVSLAIAFVLNHPLVASTVFGVTKSWQLEEVISACNVELTSEIIADINKVHAKFPNPCP
ncbi:hypothetical protein Goshw_026075 [Gossypium schwendimanii]|uniref:NADP-dependent oxidoreductase domain-containing protein n=1 Tax=Gossypium schwendimanii TaxID=34291 RepID=A0A7J9LR37_GOSSC|nr:hypothetical protein [Gossypium schwendimanii]